MGKAIQFLSLIALGTLLVLSLVLPNTPVMWIAATSSQYNFIRGLLMLALFMLLITHPPRNIYFRKFVGLVAAVIGGWSLSATYQNHMMFLDSLSILAASISMGIAVLEYEPQKQKLTIAHQIKLASLKLKNYPIWSLDEKSAMIHLWN